jgi:exopolysaccharide biosynthesis polyprenyl glycosylphosphotransferase
MITEKAQRIRYIAGDFIATSLAWFVFNIIRYFQVLTPQGLDTFSFAQYYRIRPVILGQIFFPMMMMGLYYLSGYYNRPLFRSRLDELLTTITTAIIGSIIIFFLALVDDPIPDKASNLELLGMLFVLLFGSVYIIRLSLTRYGLTKINSGSLTRPMVIIGINDESRRLRHKMENNHGRGHKIVAYVDPNAETTDDSHTFDGLKVISLNDLHKLKEDLKLTALIVPEGIVIGKTADFSEVLNLLYPLEIPILVSPNSLPIVSRFQKFGDIAGEPLVNICSTNMTDSTCNLKRMGDIIVSIAALILLSPLFLLLAILIKCDSKGPVFFRQERIGYHKKPFKIIKFRTMVNDAEINGPQLSSAGDVRITRIGHFMRKYRLDELPQFWNILCGEMSFVGPRPEREFYIKQILKKAPYYSLLHQVRPGLTSWGMVKHGYASTIDEMVERSRFDLIYLENISLIVDLKILLYTVNTVISGRGI